MEGLQGGGGGGADVADEGVFCPAGAKGGAAASGGRASASNPLATEERTEAAGTPKKRGGAAVRKPLPRPADAVACARCASTNTKFCYYNNYNSKQPRYYCRVRSRQCSCRQLEHGWAPLS